MKYHTEIVVRVNFKKYDVVRKDKNTYHRNIQKMNEALELNECRKYLSKWTL